MRRLSLLTVLSLSLCAVGCGKTAAPEWKEFKSESGNYKVLMQGKQQTQNQSVDVGDGQKLQVYITGTELPNGAYLSSYTDYPAAVVKAQSTKTLFDNVRTGVVQTYGGKVTKEGDVKVGEFPGREVYFDGNANGQSAKFFWRIYLVNNRLYQIGFLGSEPPTQDELAKFFNSFELLDPKKA